MFGSRNDKQQNKANPVSFVKTNNSNNIDTLISDACQITGDIASEQSIKIDGQVMGDINAKGTVVISSSGRVTGDVRATSLIVYGTLEGNSKTEEIHLQQGGHVEGNLETQSLQVEPEATYNGVVTMTQASVHHSAPVSLYGLEDNSDEQADAS